MFGFRSARSTLAAQWSNLRFVVQLSYRSSFATLRFASPSPSSQRAGLDSGCAGKKTYPWVGDYFLGALKSHLATCAFSPFATTISPSACPIHAAADLMAPSSRQGKFKTETHSANALWFCHPCEWPAWHLPAVAGSRRRAGLIWQINICRRLITLSG